MGGHTIPEEVRALKKPIWGGLCCSLGLFMDEVTLPTSGWHRDGTCPFLGIQKASLMNCLGAFCTVH